MTYTVLSVVSEYRDFDDWRKGAMGFLPKLRSGYERRKR